MEPDKVVHVMLLVHSACPLDADNVENHGCGVGMYSGTGMSVGTDTVFGWWKIIAVML